MQMGEDSGMNHRTPWQCCFTFILLALLGCSKPPIFHITARSDHPAINKPYKIFLRGQELGTVTGSGTFEFDAEGRKGDTFGETQPEDIEARLLWTCGWVKTDYSLYLAQPDEIERAKTEHRPVRANMNISYSPPGLDWVNIFVDNRGGPPQTVSIGELQEQVPAGTTQRIMLPHSDGCDKAKDVRLNGEIVAPVDPHKTLLIDITHSHCYREEWSGYGFDDAGHGKTIYQPKTFQFLATNPDFFMEPLPGSVVTSGNSTTRTVLKDIACPKNAH